MTIWTPSAVPTPRVRAPRKPKAASVQEAAELAPPGLEVAPSSDQPLTRARSRAPRASRAKAGKTTPEPEPEMMPPPPKKVRAPREPKAAATVEPVDQMRVLLRVVDGPFLTSLSGALRTLRKKTRDEKISALPIA